MSRSLSDAIAMMLETGTVTLDELLDARLLLEVPLAGLAAYQPDEETVERLREIVAREAEAGPNDIETYAATDMEIHRTLAAAAGNRMVQALTDWIFEVLQPSLIEVLQPAIVQSAIHEHHQALLAAVERGDPVRAERTMKDHLLYLQDVLRMVRERTREEAVIAVLGLGEAGSAIAADLAAAGTRVLGFDPAGRRRTASRPPPRPRTRPPARRSC